MGRQFSYYCTPEDLEQIETQVLRPAGGRLLMVEKYDGRERVVSIDRFALPRERMGSESLFLLLAPPESLSYIEFNGPWVNTSTSHLIEIGRCYIGDGKIRRGRFWYEANPYRDGGDIQKSQEFISWAQLVFRRTKALLARQPISTKYQTKEWFGSSAWQEVSNGKLEALLN